MKNVIISLLSVFLISDLSAHVETGRRLPHYRHDPAMRIHFKHLHSDVQGALNEAVDHSKEALAQSLSGSAQEIGGNIAHKSVQGVVNGTIAIGTTIHNLITGQKPSSTTVIPTHSINYDFELPAPSPTKKVT